MVNNNIKISILINILYIFVTFIEIHFIINCHINNNCINTSFQKMIEILVIFNCIIDIISSSTILYHLLVLNIPTTKIKKIIGICTDIVIFLLHLLISIIYFNNYHEIPNQYEYIFLIETYGYYSYLTICISFLLYANLCVIKNQHNNDDDDLTDSEHSYV